MAPIDNINRPTPSSSLSPNPPVGDGGPDDLEELVGNLDDEPTQPDPLSQRGYQPESTADRQHEIDEDDKKDERQRFIQEQLRQKEGERAGGIADKVKSAKNSFKKRFGGTPKPVAANSSGQLGAKAAAKTEAKAAASQAAKQAGRQIGRVIVKGIFTNPYVLGALAIILLIFIIIMLIFSLNAGGGNAGAGPASYPSTDAQREQATLLAALSGNKIANDQTVKNVIDDEKERYQLIKTNAQKYSPEQVSAVEKKITELNPLLDSLVATKNKEERIKIRDDVQKIMLTFEGTLPFGNWIAEIAKINLDKGSLEFCKITRASANLACASFVSTVLWEAGVPNPIQASVDAVWKTQATRIVVSRPDKKSASYYNEQKNTIKPGDLIFWGDGNCSSGGSVLFDHIGIYIGDNKAANNSSGQKKIVAQPNSAAKIDSCRVFNGAKRYGAGS